MTKYIIDLKPEIEEQLRADYAGEKEMGLWKVPDTFEGYLSEIIEDYIEYPND